MGNVKQSVVCHHCVIWKVAFLPLWVFVKIVGIWGHLLHRWGANSVANVVCFLICSTNVYRLLFNLANIIADLQNMFFKVLLIYEEMTKTFFSGRGDLKIKKDMSKYASYFNFCLFLAHRELLAQESIFSPDISPTLISLITRKLQTAQAAVTSLYGLACTLAAKPNAVAKDREVTVYWFVDCMPVCASFLGDQPVGKDFWTATVSRELITMWSWNLYRALKLSFSLGYLFGFVALL